MLRTEAQSVRGDVGHVGAHPFSGNPERVVLAVTSVRARDGQVSPDECPRDVPVPSGSREMACRLKQRMPESVGEDPPGEKVLSQGKSGHDIGVGNARHA